MKAKVLTACLIAATLLIWGNPAQGELNLFISYYFAGEDRFYTGDYQEADIEFGEAIEEKEKPHREAHVLDGLGRVYMSQGRYEESERALQEALRMKKRSLGAAHRFVPITLNNLADLHYVTGHAEAAEATYRKALELNKRDQLNLEVCRSLNGMALLHHGRGEYVQAEDLLKRAIALHDKAHRRDHPFLATSLANLGILYTNLGRYDEAGVVLERAEYIQDNFMRADHPDVAVRLTGEAALYRATGRGAQAAQASARAEAIRRAQAAAGNG